MSRSVEFTWSDADCIAIREQRAVAVYFNPDNDIVIRQQGDSGYLDDAWIVIAPDRLPALIAALSDIIGIAVVVNAERREIEAPRIAPTSTTNAERQRRYRERKRNAVTRAVTDAPEMFTEEIESKTRPAMSRTGFTLEGARPTENG